MSMMKFDGTDGVFPVVEISGGLGNQLFQYAFARKLQQVTGVSPVLSLLSYKKSIHQQRRKVEINSFLNFEFDYFPNRIPTWRLDKLGDHFRTSKRFKNNLRYLDLVPETEPFNATHISFSKHGLYKSSLVSLNYWDDIYDETISLLNVGMKRHYQELYGREFILDSSVLGVHIRRGDYLTNAKTRNFHGYCSDEYYLDAVKSMLSDFPHIRSILIFTDNAAVCVGIAEKFGSFGLEVSFSETIDAISSLFEMGTCSHLIGSNSTFSWWAAQLGVVKSSIFPFNWFAGLDNYRIDGFFKKDVTLLRHELLTQTLLTNQ